MAYPNQNCRGCGALITRPVCPYCSRRISPWDKVIPDPRDDPKRKVQLRKVKS